MLSLRSMIFECTIIGYYSFSHTPNLILRFSSWFPSYLVSIIMLLLLYFVFLSLVGLWCLLGTSCFRHSYCTFASFLYSSQFKPPSENTRSSAAMTDLDCVELLVSKALPLSFVLIVYFAIFGHSHSYTAHTYHHFYIYLVALVLVMPDLGSWSSSVCLLVIFQAFWYILYRIAYQYVSAHYLFIYCKTNLSSTIFELCLVLPTWGLW